MENLSTLGGQVNAIQSAGTNGTAGQVLNNVQQQWQTKLDNAKDQLTQDQIALTSVQLSTYEKSQTTVIEGISEDIEKSNVLIYGLIICFLALFIYTLVKK